MLQLAGRTAQVGEVGGEVVKAGPLDDAFLVQHPGPLGGQAGMGGLDDGPSQRPGAAQCITPPGIDGVGVVKAQLRGGLPERRGGVAQRRWELRTWQLAHQHQSHGQLPHHHIGGDAGQIERQPLNLEPAEAGLGQPVLDVVQVAVVSGVLDRPMACCSREASTLTW
jgi:hypothetical protein